MIAIRDAVPGDAGAVAAIYAHYVTSTAISLEETPPDAAAIAARMAARPLWLVAEDADGIAGYAYAAPFHPRAAYRWTAETTIYLASDRRRGGIGRTLYVALLDRLAAAGFTAAVAAATLPDEGTAAFHEALGFRAVGRVGQVAWKLERWWDVGYWQLDLAPRATPPDEPGSALAAAKG